MRRTALYMAMLASALLLAACKSTSTSSVSYSVSYTDEKGNTVEKSDGESVNSEIGVDASNGVTATMEVSGGAPEETEKEETEVIEETGSEAEEAETEDEAEAPEEGSGNKAYLSGTYPYGAAAEDASGITYYLLFDDPDKMTRALLMYLFPDGKTVTFAEGEVTAEEEGYTIHDMQEDMAVTFSVVESDDEGFDIQFYHTDETISFVKNDVKDVIDDVCSLLENGEIVPLKDVSAE